MELISKLENFGPFMFFFTLSCADKRFLENFTSILADEHIISYQNKDEVEKIFVDDKPLEQFLTENENKHEFIRQNVVTATRNFNNRVKQFIKHILKGPNNPMNITYYNYRIEFQMRGAAHVHGVLWVDMQKLENEKEFEGLNNTMMKIKRNEILESESDTMPLVNFVDKFISVSLKDPETRETVREVNTHHHTKSCRKYHSTCRFSFPKYPSKKTLIAQPSKRINQSESEESNENTNDKNDTSKEILRNVKDILENEELMSTLKMQYSGQIESIVDKKSILQKTISTIRRKYKKETKITKCVSEVLQLDKAQRILSNYLDLDEVFTNTRSLEHDCDKVLQILDKELNQYQAGRIDNLLKEAGVTNYDDYEKALKKSDAGYTVINKRDIDETYVNNYNREMILAWDANLDIQPCLDFYAVVSYITDYYSKDDTGTLQFLIEAAKETKNCDLKTQMKTLKDTFLTKRTMGLSEALYRLHPELHLKDSNVKSVFVPTGLPHKRSRFLKKIDEEFQSLYNSSHLVNVEGKEGKYIEKSSMIEKYVQRPAYLEKMCLCQFCQRYEPVRKIPKIAMEKITESTAKDKNNCYFAKDENDDIGESSNKNSIITSSETENKPLPSYILLNDVLPGEPKYMRLCKPSSLRFHKFKQSSGSACEYQYSELLLYQCFRDESELHPDNDEECLAKYLEMEKEICEVKSQCMPYLEDVEEGRLKAELSQEEIAQRLASELDAAGEQLDEDCAEVGISDDMDHLGREPGDLLETNNSVPEKNFYKQISVSNLEDLKKMTMMLDKEQRQVVDISMKYATDIVKATAASTCPPNAPKLIIQGGAGSGKSTVIDVLSQWVEHILRKSGDKTSHPYVLKLAPTGTAANIIKGQTMHNAFGFNFGNEFYSLTDKNRDSKRTLLQNLKMVIIDEMSMIKSDLLYQLDLRLKEITQQHEKDFGGVAVFLLGDLLQLKPVCAKYIFDRPSCNNYHVSYDIEPLWNTFGVINLIENHRSAEQKHYADLLNRIRFGTQTPDDINLLKTRVREENHPELPSDAVYIMCKNVDVKRINEQKLQLIKSEEVNVKAKHFMKTKEDFEPVLEKDGSIRNAPFENIFKFKIGAKCMLTYNLDTSDGLTNGARGKILDFCKNKSGEVTTIIVQFEDETVGKEKRNQNPSVKTKYPGMLATPIEKMEFEYSLSKKAYSTSSTAKTYQYPLKLCFAATAHKFQGQTIRKPNKLIMDLRSVFEPSQAEISLRL